MYRKNAKSGSSIAAILLKGVVRTYQVVVSPWIAPRCRFVPTCSHYMSEAVQQHGFFRGSLLGLRRFFRCHPFNPGGLDPVPEREEER